MQGPIEDNTIYLMIIAALAFIVGVSSLVYSITKDKSAKNYNQKTTNDLLAIKNNTCIIGTAFLKVNRGENIDWDDLESGLRGLD
jgi:hypothetical protein